MRTLLPYFVTLFALPVIRVWRAVSARAAKDGPDSFLVIRVDAIGDVVLTLPLLAAIRAARPAARITVVATSQTRSILDTCEAVDEVLVFDASKGGTLGRARRVVRAIAFGLGRLLPRRFSAAIVPRWDVDDFDAGVLAFCSGASRRIAFSEAVNAHKAITDRRMDHYYTDVVTDRGVTHEAIRPLKLLLPLGIATAPGAMTIRITDEDRARAREVAGMFPVDRPLLAFAVGAAHPRRRWPADRFIAAARALAEETAGSILVLGGPAERALGAEIAAGIGVRAGSAAGELTLRETAALLEQCSILVTNDSGPLHLGAAMGIPIVEISCHPADGDPALEHSPLRFGPWGVAHAILQPSTALGPCRGGTCVSAEAHCIIGVPVDAVVDAARALLKGDGRSRARADVAAPRPRENEVKSLTARDGPADIPLDRGAGQGAG